MPQDKFKITARETNKQKVSEDILQNFVLFLFFLSSCLWEMKLSGGRKRQQEIQGVFLLYYFNIINIC